MRQIVQSTCQGTARTFAQYRAALLSTIGNTGDDIRVVLASLCSYSSSIDKFKVMNADKVTHQGIGVALYSVLTQFQPFPKFEPEKTPVFVEKNKPLILSCEGENIIEEWIQLPEGHQKLELAKLSLIRTISESGLYQQEVLYKIANSAVLAGFKRFRRLGVDSKIIDQLFSLHLGIGAYDYYLYLIMLWNGAGLDGIINPQVLFEKAKQRKRTISEAVKIAKEISYRTSDFAPTSLSKEIEGLSEKFRGSAYFSIKPLIDLENGHFASAAPTFFRAQITSKFLEKAKHLARMAEPKSKGSTKLTDHMGKVRLEEYFRELCNEWSPPFGHENEYFYVEGKRSSDRIIFETVNGQPVCTLVQVKLKSVPTRVHFTESWNIVRDDYKKAFSELIFNSLNYLFNAEQEKAAASLNEETKRLTEKILGYRDFFFLGVVPDLPAIFSIKYPREILMNEVLAKIKKEPNMLSWFNERFGGNITWHIFDLTEFQWIMSLPRECGIAQTLREYISVCKVDDDPFDENGHMTDTFKNFLIKKFFASSGQIPLHPAIAKVGTSVFADTKYRFFRPWSARLYWILKQWVLETLLRMFPGVFKI